MTYLKAILFLLVFSATGVATAGQNNSIPELCGQTSKPTMGPFLRWDCSNINAQSIDSLESLVKETHDISYSKDPDFKVYFSKQAKPFSAWIFDGKKAARYRAIFQDDIWQGVGVTTYCSDTASACTAFETFSASAIPKPLVFQLGPPPPELPPVVK